MKKPIKITESNLNKLIQKVMKEQVPVKVNVEEEILSTKNDFTSADRRMLHAIYDVLVKGGSGGGYKSGRKRALTPIGALPTMENSQRRRNKYTISEDSSGFKVSDTQKKVIQKCVKQNTGIKDIKYLTKIPLSCYKAMITKKSQDVGYCVVDAGKAFIGNPQLSFELGAKARVIAGCYANDPLTRMSS